MKNIEPKLIELFKQGYCTPQISQIAKKLKEPSTTIHYNIKRMESEGKIKNYKAILDYKKINQGFCSFILIKLSPEQYANPEKIAKQLSDFNEIESIDIVTGQYEIIAKARVKDHEEYYKFIKRLTSINGIVKAFSLVSLKQIKSEFVEIHN